MLFNDENLEGWDFYVADSTIPPEQVFFVKDGVIHISGDPFGYMRTTITYSDYELHVEWRWADQPGNSGVFLNNFLNIIQGITNFNSNLIICIPGMIILKCIPGKEEVFIPA